jgi:hypothetical protein
MKIKNIEEEQENFTGVLEWCDGCKTGHFVEFKEVFQDGKLHNLYGPAVFWLDGKVRYYIDGLEYSVRNWDTKIEKLRKSIKSHTK